MSRSPVDFLEFTTINETASSPPVQANEEPEVNRLFRLLRDQEASDLHLKVGQPPRIRVRGAFQPLSDQPLSRDDMERLALPLLTDRQRNLLAQEGGVDFSYVVGRNEGRFRLSLFRQRGNLSLVAQPVTAVIPRLEQLGLPESIKGLCKLSSGLIVLAGLPGSGRKTTIRAMLDHINERNPVHILTIEDPIEFVFTDKKGSVDQREIGSDVLRRSKALEDAAGQDVDVFFVGQLLDASTVETALSAAESGKLVFGTITSFDPPSAIKGILDLFLPEKCAIVRKMLGRSLKSIVAQKLLEGLTKSRVVATEIMIVNPTVRRLIEEGADEKLPDAIRLFYQEGMCDFTESLRQLRDQGDIDKATALEYAPDPEKLKMAFKGIKVSAPGILPDTPAAPAPPPTVAPVQVSAPAKQDLPPTVRRRATVRYFTRMYPNTLYRLLVVLSREEVRKLVQSEVEQAISQTFAVRQQEPIEIEPLIPGCSVYPPRREVTVSGDSPVEARFQVLAHLQGGSVADAVVVIRQGGRELARVSLVVHVGKPTLAYGLAAASVVVPMVLKYLKLDLDAQAGDDFSGYLSLLNTVLGLPWWMWTTPLLLASAVAAWWYWPREDVFWNIELDSLEKRGPG